MTLDQQLETAAKLIRSIFEKSKALTPMIHAIGKDGHHHVLEVPQLGGTDIEKDMVSVALRKTFDKLNIRQYIMIIEAWTLRLPPNHDLKEIPRPRDHADRVEVIAFQAEHQDGDNACGEMIITRDANGDPSLGELTTWRSTVLHGRLTGLLQKPIN